MAKAINTEIKMNTKSKVWKYRKLEIAKSACYRCIKSHRIFQGNDGHFWLVTMADGERLAAAGMVEVRS
jgi:hypothetical protein